MSPPAASPSACDIFSYLLSNSTSTKDAPWSSTIDHDKRLTRSQASLLLRRLAAGFDRMGIPTQASVLLISPTTIHTPVIYLATAGSGRIFTTLPPSSSISEICSRLQSLKPALILADPNTALEKVLEAVATSGTGLRDRVFSFEEDDWSDPKNGILDWKILMARAVDGRSWQPFSLDEATARKTVAVVAEDGTASSHYDIVANAIEITRRRPEVDPWLAILPWHQSETAPQNQTRSRL